MAPVETSRSVLTAARRSFRQDIIPGVITAMEEVDNIILHTLRQIGSEISTDIVSLTQLDTSGLVEGCARCLNIINGNDDVCSLEPTYITTL